MDSREIIRTMTISAISPAIAAIFTNPFDVAKTRLQMQNELTRTELKVYKNPIDCLIKTWRAEGIKGLQRGLGIAMVRESSKCFFRIGLYEPLLSHIHNMKVSQPPIWKCILAGGTSGAVAALITNPLEITKSRIQAHGALTTAHLHYDSAKEAISDTIRKDGFKGLWKGVEVSILRSMVWTAVQLPCNTMLKHVWSARFRVNSNFDILRRDGTCALLSSFVALCFQNPLDVIRTRLYNQPMQNRLYAVGIANIFRQILYAEGPGAFYKGFWAYYFRAGPHSVLTFMLIGQFKGLLNMRN